MAGWCNGTAGFVLLWTEAFLSTGDLEWRALAHEAGRHCMTYAENLNSVCCGLAGRAYALGVLWSATGEREWLEAAHRLLKHNANTTPDAVNYPHSLFKGQLGHELARLELSAANQVTFPMLASDLYGEPLPVGPLVFDRGGE